AAADHGCAVWLRDGERRGAVQRPPFPAELDASRDRGSPPVPGVRSWQFPAAVPAEPQGPGLSTRIRGTHDPLCRQPRAHAPGGGAGTVEIRWTNTGRTGRGLDFPADRSAQLSAHTVAVRLLLV